jgi:hypothetical protein
MKELTGDFSTKKGKTLFIEALRKIVLTKTITEIELLKKLSKFKIYSISDLGISRDILYVPKEKPKHYSRDKR